MSLATGHPAYHRLVVQHQHIVGPELACIGKIQGGTSVRCLFLAAEECIERGVETHHEVYLGIRLLKGLGCPVAQFLIFFPMNNGKKEKSICQREFEADCF